MDNRVLSWNSVLFRFVVREQCTSRVLHSNKDLLLLQIVECKIEPLFGKLWALTGRQIELFFLIADRARLSETRLLC